MDQMAFRMRLHTPSFFVTLFVSALCLFGNAAHAQADEVEYMKPLYASDFMSPSQMEKRAIDFSQLDGRSTDSLLWGKAMDDGVSMALAQMTLFAGEVERIVTLERVRPMLKYAECGENMTLAFNTKDQFEYAINDWGWVNDNEDKTIMLVVDGPACDYEDRAPYIIHDVDYDEENFIAYLFGEEQEWEAAAHDFDLAYGNAEMSNLESALAKRFDFDDLIPDIPKPDLDWEWKKDWKLPIDKEFNGKIINEERKEGDLKLECVDCSTSGHFKSEVEIKVRALKPEDIHFSIEPEDVRAGLGFKLETRIPKSPVPVSLSYSQEVFKMPIGPAIPPIKGIAELGFYFAIQIGISTTPEKADATMEFGIDADLSNDAIAQLSLAGKEDSKVDGWSPNFKSRPFHFDGDFAGKVNVYVQWTVGPKIELFGTGFDAQVVARFPDFENRFDTFNEKGSNTTCEKKGMDGLSIDTYAGASIGVRAGKSGDLAVTAEVAPAVFGGKIPGQKRAASPRIRGSSAAARTDIEARSSGTVAKRLLGARVQLTLYKPKGIKLGEGHCINGHKTSTSKPTAKPTKSKSASKTNSASITNSKTRSTPKPTTITSQTRSMSASTSQPSSSSPSPPTYTEDPPSYVV